MMKYKPSMWATMTWMVKKSMLNHFGSEFTKDILPICCDIDYETAKRYRAKLHREQTLASGGKICDYWFVPDQITNPK